MSRAGVVVFVTHGLPELRAARAAGMVAPSICPDGGPFIGAFDPADRQTAMTALRDLLDVAAEIGAAGVITPAAYGIHSNRLPPFNPPRPPEETGRSALRC